MKKMMSEEGVVRTTGSMCMYGMTQGDEEGIAAVRKDTSFMTNSPEIAARLSNMCDGSHRHIRLEGSSRTRRAQVYPEKLCEEIFAGLVAQMKKDGRLNNGEIGAVMAGEEAELRVTWEDTE